MGKIAVLGLGSSVTLYLKEAPFDFDCSIGVNDIWRYVKTDYICCVDPPKSFTPERMKIINESQPIKFFSQFVNWDTRKDFEKILIFPGYPDLICRIDTPPYEKSYTSPFVATQIAYKKFGATEIHLFGVDMVNHPYLKGDICNKIKLHFSNLNRALKAKDCHLIIHGEGILTNLVE